MNRKKCILINLKADKYNMKTAPQALAKLGGILLKRERWEVKYLDEQIMPINNLLSIIQELQPDFIGISSQAGTVNSLWKVLKQISEVFIKIPIFIGNITATYGYKSILKKYPQVFCSIGRGERTFWKIAEIIEENQFNKNVHCIPNIAYVSQKTGKIIVNNYAYSCGEEIECLSDWEGVFRDSPVDNYEEFWLEFSHGCPRKANNIGCIYCAIMPDGESRKWHPRNINNVIQDYMALVSKGVKHIKFSDEEFLSNSPERIIELANAIHGINKKIYTEKGIHITFDFSARVDDIVRLNKYNYKNSNGNQNLNCLNALKEAGLLQIYLGLESGNDAQLKRMKKGVNVSDNYEAIKILKQLHIRIAGGWIMFDPFMKNPKELLHNSKFLKQAGLIPHSVTDDFVTNTTGQMRVLVGSPLVGMLDEVGLLRKLNDNLIEYDFDYIDPVIYDIVKKIEEWETIKDKKLMYRAKSIISLLGDNCDCGLTYNEQISLTNAFFDIKLLDLQMCDELSKQAIAKNNGSPSRYSLSFNKELLNKHEVAVKKIYRILKGMSDNCKSI